MPPRPGGVPPGRVPPRRPHACRRVPAPARAAAACPGRTTAGSQAGGLPLPGPESASPSSTPQGEARRARVAAEVQAEALLSDCFRGEQRAPRPRPGRRARVEAMDPVLLIGTASPHLGRALGAALGVAPSDCHFERFPDGEMHVEVPASVRVAPPSSSRRRLPRRASTCWSCCSWRMRAGGRALPGWRRWCRTWATPGRTGAPGRASRWVAG